LKPEREVIEDSEFGEFVPPLIKPEMENLSKDQTEPNSLIFFQQKSKEFRWQDIKKTQDLYA
jgi:hypothetical protein